MVSTTIAAASYSPRTRHPLAPQDEEILLRRRPRSVRATTSCHERMGAAAVVATLLTSTGSESVLRWVRALERSRRVRRRLRYVDRPLPASLPWSTSSARSGQPRVAPRKGLLHDEPAGSRCTCPPTPSCARASDAPARERLRRSPSGSRAPRARPPRRPHPVRAADRAVRRACYRAFDRAVQPGSRADAVRCHRRSASSGDAVIGAAAEDRVRRAQAALALRIATLRFLREAPRGWVGGGKTR